MDGAEILFASKDIRTRIVDLLSQSTNRRYAIVAFVGSDASDFARGDAAGLVIYCWPHPIATSPEGLRALMNAGAVVYFVSNLHAKIYWSRRGFAIGSPNLSRNALGAMDNDATLLEVLFCCSDPDALDIASIIDRLDASAVLVTEQRLSEFSESREFLPTSNPEVQDWAIGTFSTHLSQRFPVRWSFAPWSEETRSDSSEDSALLAAVSRFSRGEAHPDSIRVTEVSPACRATRAQWVLLYRHDNGNCEISGWQFPHFVITVDGKVLIGQHHGLRVPRAPFRETDEDFKKRFLPYLTHLNKHGVFDGVFSVDSFVSWEDRNR